jgi:hypothetical protein
MQNLILRHIHKVLFSFIELFHPGLILVKSTNISRKKFLEINLYGYYTEQNLMPSLNPLKKNTKRSPKKVIDRKLLHTVIKVKKFIFLSLFC